MEEKERRDKVEIITCDKCDWSWDGGCHHPSLKYNKGSRPFSRDDVICNGELWKSVLLAPIPGPQVIDGWPKVNESGQTTGSWGVK